MKLSSCPLLVIFLLVISSQWCSAARRRGSNRSGNCVDMTRSMHEGMLHLPKQQGFQLSITTTDAADAKLQYDVMTTPTHMGTHMVAPRHFDPSGLSVDEIPIQNFNGVPAYVIDVRNQSNKDSGYQIEVKDIEDWQIAHGITISNGSLVLFKTGWGERWPDAKRFLGTDQDDPEQLKFPGLSALAATWLSQRGPVGVGTECASINPNGEATKIASRTILGSPHNMYVLQNLANMDQVPAKGAKVYAFPMKIENGSGSPTRVISCFRERSSSSNKPNTRSSRRRQH